MKITKQMIKEAIKMGLQEQGDEEKVYIVEIEVDYSVYHPKAAFLDPQLASDYKKKLQAKYDAQDPGLGVPDSIQITSVKLIR